MSRIDRADMRNSGNGLFGKRQRYSARGFYLTALCITTIIAFTFALEAYESRFPTSTAQLFKRDTSPLHKRQDLECNLIHKAQDKCAFVKANCEDEEAGLISYLSLYYCRIPNAKPVAMGIIILWMCLLFSTIGIAASDFFCPNLSTIANVLGLSESLAGVTFLAFGNGSPDVFSTFAAFNTHSGSLAIGELIGAASFITAGVAGCMAITRPFKVTKKSFVRDVLFFTVAAAFSMVFMYDGKLYLWECIAMVCFYVFYVIFVVAWHWYYERRRKRRQKEAAARAQFVMPGEEGAEAYHDDPDENRALSRTTSLGMNAPDFAALERGDEADSIDEEEEEEEAEREFGQLKSQMRLSRPGLGPRQPTRTTIRPSLVGVLEFNAVMSGLQKSRNIQTMPLYLRRYSDDPRMPRGDRSFDRLSTVSDPSVRPPQGDDISPVGDTSLLMPSRPSMDGRGATPNRARAVSANDADHLHINPNMLPRVDLLAPLSEDEGSSRSSRRRNVSSVSASAALPSPAIDVTSPGDLVATDTAPHPSNLLAPPSANFPSAQSHSQPLRNPNPNISTPSSGDVSPRTTSPERQLPKLAIPSTPRRGSTSTSFPLYTDYPVSATNSTAPPSIMLQPSVSHDSFGTHQLLLGQRDTKPWRWWPYRILPAPQDLFFTLFPTLSAWEEKSIWEKALAIVAAPSVFLLTLTLPVIETERDEPPKASTHSFSLHPPLTPGDERASRNKSFPTIIEPSSSAQAQNRERNGSISYMNKGLGGHGNAATVAASNEYLHEQAEHPSTQILSPSINPHSGVMDSPEQLPTQPSMGPPPAQEWNRWLIILQTFTAPFFIVLVLWANLEADDSRSPGRILLHWSLWGLLVSCITVLPIITFTTPTRPPKWRTVLCFLGFVVSISWISTIAGEVVGVLKALGVILNISDAILGLTIFAVGNSCGDLVADITVAKLGYPVMALSACFGGPMLNILLGIGLSGLYMSINGANNRHERHPDKGFRYKPYHLDVSRTLVVSGATLLVTLLGLLIAVPLRGWRMDRLIGWGLVTLWVVSTLGNVGLELSGYGGDLAF